MIREARYYSKLDDTRVRCDLCPAECKLKEGQRGICQSRYNESNRLVTDNFGETVTLAIDPIEKKPLYHFYPGQDIASIGVNGCNLSCKHCQNWEISQGRVPTRYIDPKHLPEIGAQRGSIGIAYTYTEPLIWFEYLLEAAPLVREVGLVNVLVTNGYVNPDPLRELLPLVDAFNVDLKAMRPEFYRRICKGRLEPVLEAIRIIADSPAHLEITNLVIPELNDSDEDFHRLGEFLTTVDRKIPLHLSAYYPAYQLDKPATPRRTMLRACEILEHYVSYVFVGNMQIEGRSDSRCPECGHTLVERVWYRIQVSGLDADGTCLNCGHKSDIIVTRR